MANIGSSNCSSYDMEELSAVPDNHQDTPLTGKAPCSLGSDQICLEINLRSSSLILTSRFSTWS